MTRVVFEPGNGDPIEGKLPSDGRSPGFPRSLVIVPSDVLEGDLVAYDADGHEPTRVVGEIGDPGPTPETLSGTSSAELAMQSSGGRGATATLTFTRTRPSAGPGRAFECLGAGSRS